MRADFKVLLDACVLVNFPVCDLILRLAEPPRLFLPVWSDEILEETSRAQKNKLHWPEKLVEGFRSELGNHFPDSECNDYSHLIESLDNDPKDRHVLAAAIRAGSQLILTFNLKDFPRESLQPWGVAAKHPQNYLLSLYSMEPQIVVQKIAEIAAEKHREFDEHLLHLGKFLPAFASHLIDDLGLDV
ncbi:PIN domain-containing protein [Akkermansiaceae bacterium]|nr:PIN domain-containing protein [Akkermansiaceae bacterium]